MKREDLQRMAKVLTLSLTLGFGNVVWAANGTQIMSAASGGSPTGIYYDGKNIYWGADTTAIDDFSTAFGRMSIASGKYSTAFGSESKAGLLRDVDGLDSTERGYGATAWGRFSQAGAIKLNSDDDMYIKLGLTAEKIFSGNYATAFGEGTLAIGIDSLAFGSGTIASCDQATAWGSHTIASGSGATAFGQNAKASGWYSTAFGSTTIASGDSATAFGSMTIASGGYSTAFGGTTIASGSGATAFGVCSKAEGDFSTAFGYYTRAVGENSTAFGNGSKANGENSTAFGSGAKAGGDNSLAALGGVTGDWSGAGPTGGTNAVAIGVGANAKADNSVAIGYYAVAYNSLSPIGETSNYETQFAVGGGNDGNGHTYYARITGVSDGVEAHDAVTVGQVNSMVETQVAAVAATGSTLSTEQLAAIDSGITSVKVGNYDEHISDTTVHITADERTAWNAKQDALNGDSEVSIKKLTTSGTVTAGGIQVADVKINNTGINAGNTKITNVADGEAPTDAATVGQVSSVAGDLQSEINTLNGQIDHMGTRINKVGAGAAALAAMHPVYDEDSKLTFSAGLGAYRNEKAAAVGMFFRFSPRVMMNAGATVGNDNNMYNVGLNFALDRHVRGGLPSKAVMAKQLTAQSAEIADLKAQIAQLIAMIEELKNK